jgi:hypothetical protein
MTSPRPSQCPPQGAIVNVRDRVKGALAIAVKLAAHRITLLST